MVGQDIVGSTMELTEEQKEKIQRNRERALEIQKKQKEAQESGESKFTGVKSVQTRKARTTDRRPSLMALTMTVLVHSQLYCNPSS
jgi:uncharacterized membrane protein (DUF106 family)